jgi:hypothetical protein
MMVGRPLSDLFNKERDIPRAPRLNVHHLTDGKKYSRAACRYVPAKSSGWPDWSGPDVPSWRS